MGALIRVALADDEGIIREGLAALLRSDPGLQVVGVFADGRQLVDAVAAGLLVDVALVDINMPVLDGLAATQLLASTPTGPVVIILTTFAEHEYVISALAAGASGFLLKRSTRHDLLSAVRAAAAGDAVLSAGVTRGVVSRLLDSGSRPSVRLPDLTTREVEVLTAIGAGLNNSEIAQALFLSESTVKAHVSHVLAKTASRDRVQAALLAVRAGLTE